MTFADTRGNETSILRSLRAALTGVWADIANRRNFGRTYNELSKLNNRELDDLGIARSQIAEVSHRAAYGN